jgi:hypothetical protein
MAKNNSEIEIVEEIGVFMILGTSKEVKSLV